MLGMRLTAPGGPLTPEFGEDPAPERGEVRLRVLACGVCRTDLHVVDGDLPLRCEHVVPGHQAVGVVEALGEGVAGVAIGDRLGVPWLGGACGTCFYCRTSRENLCDHPTFTGWTCDGGFADTMIARADFCIPIPPAFGDQEAAPLLCAGLIGYRALRMACEAGPVERLGLYGFGAAAHLLAQLAVHHGQAVHAFTRAGDFAAQALALELGCAWAGGSDASPEAPLDAAIIFAPDGTLVPRALAAVRKAGVVICAGIHMSDIPSFSYHLLWGERRLVSVANLTRADARAYFLLAAEAGVKAHIRSYSVLEANAALADLRRGAFSGAAVLVP
jgi:propanol-preferring alcohol dehydrogenase